MDKQKLWRIFIEKNPEFVGFDKVAMTPNAIKKMFDLVWQQAHKKGFNEGRTTEKVEAKLEKLKEGLAGVLGGKDAR